jgi:hypothetical protein
LTQCRHQHLNMTRVVTHALVYEWTGSDPSLKPLLLTGHQGRSAVALAMETDELDVVPVLPATRHMWTHDPFGGEYDGKLIWGRGSSDDKSGTIGALYVKTGFFTEDANGPLDPPSSSSSNPANSTRLVRSSWHWVWTKRRVERWFVSLVPFFGGWYTDVDRERPTSLSGWKKSMGKTRWPSSSMRVRE